MQRPRGTALATGRQRLTKTADEQEPIKDSVGTYKAPAAEKALDILEYMATTPEPQKQSQIAAGVGRSIQEVYRIIQLLERRGYLERDPASDLYIASLKLFTLAHSTQQIRGLSDAAIGPMRDLADAINQSCHVAVLTGAEVAIVCQVNSPLAMRYSVSPGARFPAHQTSSGLVLLAGLTPDRRHSVLETVANMLTPDEDMTTVSSYIESVLRQGCDIRPSLVVAGVTNISLPIRDFHGETTAVLTVPFLPMKDMTASLETAIQAAANAAEEISRRLGYRGERLVPRLPDAAGPAMI